MQSYAEAVAQDRQLAEAYRVDHPTIQDIRARHEATGRLSHKQRGYVLALARQNKRPESVDLTGVSLTDEQTAIIAAAEKIVSAASVAEWLKIKAFAGTGKTFTLKALSGVLSGKRVLYIVFNKANQMEAEEKFPKHVEVRTWHSLAFASCGKRFKGRLVGSIMPLVKELENRAEIADLRSLSEGDDRAAAFVCVQTLNRFAQSDAAEPNEDHVPAAFLSRIKGNRGAKRRATNAAIRCATKAWAAIVEDGSTLPATHDYYLKLWALSSPQLPHEVIMLDEAQDTNPVALKVLADQQDKSVVLVGDSWQQIYSFRGAVDAMANSPGRELFLTRSFRFGENVAAQANRVLAMLGETTPLVGAGTVAGEILDNPEDTEADAVLCRGNAGVVREALIGMDAGRKVGVAGGVDEAVRLFYAVYDIYTGQKTDHPDVALFETWDELAEFAETDEGRALGSIVRLVEREGHGTPNLCRRLKWETVDESEADLVISTAHKSKGREWDRVRFAEDFPPLVEEITDENGKVVAHDFKREEANLLYVSITRAQKRLNLGGYGFLLADAERLLAEMRNPSQATLV